MRPFFIQDMSYDYKKTTNTGKGKNAQKIHTRMISQPKKLSCSLTTLKIFDCVFFPTDQRAANYWDTVKRKQKPTIMGKYAEDKHIFNKTGCIENVVQYIRDVACP